MGLFSSFNSFAATPYVAPTPTPPPAPEPVFSPSASPMLSTAVSPYAVAPTPTRDDMLGPGNTAPTPPPTSSLPNYGMAGSIRTNPLPLAAVQQPFGGMAVVRPPVSSANAQGGVSFKEGDNSPFMPGGITRRPETRTGGIMTQSHPDFIGRRMSDISGGVRPGAMPSMNAVQAARQAQANRGVNPQGTPPFMR